MHLGLLFQAGGELRINAAYTSETESSDKAYMSYITHMDFV
jgi:hypothetical protein